MPVAEIPAVAPDQLRRTARRLRDEASRSGAPGLNLRVRDVLAELPLPYPPEPVPRDATPDEIAEAALEPLEFADGVLTRHGIRCRPSLAAAGPEGVVTLRPTRRFAIQGAALLGIAALVGGGLASTIALIGFAPFVVAGIALVAWQMPRLDRYAPRFVPRGRMLGALVMAILLTVSAVAVVQPTRERVREQGNRTNAIVLVQEADTRLAAGDLAGALASANGAVANDPAAPGVQETLTRVDAAARARLGEAEASQAAGDWDLAIAQLESLEAFYDAPRLIEQVRRSAAIALIADTEAALEAGDPNAALDAYGRAITYDPALADDTLIDDIADAFAAR